MAQQTINVGAAPNDGTGTPLRTAFQYTNSNFTELYTALGGGAGLPGATTQVIFNDGGTNLAGDAGLTYNKTTDTLSMGAATITGDLTVDTSTLKVDSANNRVGVLTASPQAELDVRGGANIGDGTTTVRVVTASNVGYVGTSTNDPLVIRTNAVDRARFDTSGNLGLGVTPKTWSTGSAIEVGNYFLKLAGSGTFGGAITNNAYYNSGWKYAEANYANMYQTLSGEHRFWNAGVGANSNDPVTFTQAMTLDASGNLLVGTTTMPSGVTLARLVAKSTSGDWSGVIWNSNATPYGFRIQHDTDSNGTGNEFLYCLGGANLRASIRSNGGFANYQANDVSLSDSRLKTDIKPLASYWNKIKSLELVTFKYKDQTHSDDNIGLIAQQVESVAPELVDVDGFGETPDDGVPLKTIYTTDLYHAAIKALQEAMTRIEALEAKLA